MITKSKSRTSARAGRVRDQGKTSGVAATAPRSARTDSKTGVDKHGKHKAATSATPHAAAAERHRASASARAKKERSTGRDASSSTPSRSKGGAQRQTDRTALAPTARATPRPQTPGAPRPHSKLGIVVKLLGAADGATLDRLIEATGWLPHTMRAALTGLRKRGYAVERVKDDSGSRYRIAAGGRAKSDAPAV